jgi:hypothetical protein
MRTIFVFLALTACSEALSATPSNEIRDPLEAFVLEQYPRGSDFFVHGDRDTTLYRCVADFNGDGRADIALSEQSIWGNRTGPFEIFIQEPDGRFRYLHTVDYESEMKPLCGGRLQSCSSNQYLSSGKCTWKKGIGRGNK